MAMKTSAWLSLALAASLGAQDGALDPERAFRVTLPAGAPVTLTSANWDQSKATPRGGALLVDLHSTLQLKNESPRRVRAISLQVVAQEVTPGGKGSVTVPSLDVAPGESFAVRIDLRLMRPLTRGGGTLVEVTLDGLLFDDMTFYGPDVLKSRRSLVAWELEARRDRRLLLTALEQGGRTRLQEEMVIAAGRLREQSGVEMRVARAQGAAEGRELAFAFLALPGAPVQLMRGTAWVAPGEARTPRIEVTNRGRRTVRSMEIGWIVQDVNGRQFVAGTLPAEINIPPGQEALIQRDRTLRFTRPGQPGLEIAALSAYVGMVEFDDGEVWVPVRGAPALSGEMRRLVELYRRHGLDVVVAQLQRFE
jgi:hypothetical protein